MSVDTHGKPVVRPRCEAVTLDAIHSSTCVHSSSVASGDAAILIGLVLSFVRQGHLPVGVVPEPLMAGLHARARHGDPACRLLLDWLGNRSRRFADAPIGAQTRLAINDAGRRSRRSPRDPAENLQAAIIAAETGGRADG